MRSARVLLKFIALVGSWAVALPTYALDTDLTYTGSWRNSDDVVNGWDWSLPSGVKPAVGSGIYNLNSAVPPNFPGNHLKQVNAKWSELEPVEGRYDFSSILRELNDPNYDGIMLNVRGMVVSVKDKDGRPALSSEITAPVWLSSQVPTITEDLAPDGYAKTNMQLSSPLVKERLIKLIKALGATGIAANPRLVAQIVHGVGSSRGEEWSGKQVNDPAAIAAMKEILAAWATAYQGHTNKLAWIKEKNDELYDFAVNKAGMGIRGSIIENWLRAQYMNNPTQTGQVYDQGYLNVDESYAPIAQRRLFLDQNEEYTWRMFTSPERLQQNYRMSNLRVLQMRRNVLWTEKDSFINPKLLNWLSLELGQTVTTAPDAWVVLFRSWSRFGEDRPVNNFERWLYQRDINGIATTPVMNRDHSFNASGNYQLDKSKWNIDLARSAPAIGIAVDDRFVGENAAKVAVKVTYLDSESTGWSLAYTKADGTTAERKVQGSASQVARTATFFLNDFKAPKKGYDFDLWLRSQSGKTPFMFVRLIKLDAVANNAAPNPPANLVVE